MRHGRENATKAKVTLKDGMKGKHEIEKGIVYSQRRNE
jgi:hypothetical protein